MIPRLGIGLAALAVDGYAGRPRPQRDDAIALLREAYDAGVRYFETAPTYGENRYGERLLADALGDRPGAIFATKFSLSLSGSFSVEGDASREILGPNLRVWQAHNATASDEDQRRFNTAHLYYSAGLHVGATVYDRKAFQCYAGDEMFIQAPYSILDQRFADLFLLAHKRAFIIARQPLLHGVLTDRPPANAPPALVDAARGLAVRGLLARDAIRFALANPHIDIVLTGVATGQELDTLLSAAASDCIQYCHRAAIWDDDLLDVRRWEKP